MGTELVKTTPLEELKRLMDAADRKNPTEATASALRSHLLKHPELVERMGNVLVQAAHRVMGSVSLTESSKEFWWANYDQVKQQLGYDAVTALERMLIESIALAWMALAVAQHKQATFETQGGAIKEGVYWDRRVNAANRRYMQSIEALARVRKLATVTPAIFNIANQQVVNTGEGLR